jgi:ubiquinone/menaquinone biosynthesis C-methylase UbiE
VLEVGIGAGLNLPFYRDEVAFVTGLDPSPELLRRPAIQSAHNVQCVHLIQATAETIPLKNESVDTVVMTWTLCSLKDACVALAEMRRVLKHEGELLFAEHVCHPRQTWRRGSTALIHCGPGSVVIWRIPSISSCVGLASKF